MVNKCVFDFLFLFVQMCLTVSLYRERSMKFDSTTKQDQISPPTASNCITMIEITTKAYKWIRQYCHLPRSFVTQSMNGLCLAHNVWRVSQWHTASSERVCIISAFDSNTTKWAGSVSANRENIIIYEYFEVTDGKWKSHNTSHEPLLIIIFLYVAWALSRALLDVRFHLEGENHYYMN